MTSFETRCLGRTPLRVTVLGLGTGTLGGHRIPVGSQFRQGGYRALERWRAYGDLAAIGVGVNEREILLEAI